MIEPVSPFASERFKRTVQFYTEADRAYTWKDMGSCVILDRQRLLGILPV